MASIIKVNTIQDATNSNTAMTIDSTGRILTPARPSFAAHLSADVNYGTADAYQKLTFNSTHHNVGGHYSTSTGKFTAPLTGIYYLAATVYMYSTPVAEFKFYINGSSLYRFATNSKGDGSVNPNGGTGSVIAQLTANDYVEVYVLASTTATIYKGSSSSQEVATFWSGCLIG